MVVMHNLYLKWKYIWLSKKFKHITSAYKLQKKLVRKLGLPYVLEINQKKSASTLFLFNCAYAWPALISQAIS